MALDYTTKSGDTWDLIALNVYGSELKADWLMQNNPRYNCTGSPSVLRNGVGSPKGAVLDLSECEDK